MSLTMAARMAQLDAQLPDPGSTRESIDAWLDACQAQSERLDEEHRLWLGEDRTPAVCMTHEVTGSWGSATADRWFRALPERYMTPDSLHRPDWDHSHYPHDAQGRIGRVTTRRPRKTGSPQRQSAPPWLGN